MKKLETIESKKLVSLTFNINKQMNDKSDGTMKWLYIVGNLLISTSNCMLEYIYNVIIYFPNIKNYEI